jgi:hypothetical protein
LSPYFTFRSLTSIKAVTYCPSAYN